MTLRFFYACPLAVFLLSGCQLDTRHAFVDYTGNDAAKIRVLDKGTIGLKVYEKSGDCYKEVDARKLTSTFHLSLLTQADYSVGTTKTVGMIPSEKFKGKSVKEYIIKSGQYLEIINSLQETKYNGTTEMHHHSTYFVPESNHQYEIHAELSEYNYSPVAVTIEDLTSKDPIKGWIGTICKKSGFFSF